MINAPSTISYNYPTAYLHQNKNTQYQSTSVAEAPKYDVNIYPQTTSIYKDNISSTTPELIHTSWFYVNDVHGKMTKMERIYNVAQEFVSTPSQKVFPNFFSNSTDKVSKFKVNSGDILIGANSNNNKVASEFLRWCRFDAGIPGNHEFDVPDPSNLASLIKDTDTTCLAANIIVKSGSPLEGRFESSKIIERDGELYGFIGISPSDMTERVKMNPSMADIEVLSVDDTIKKVQSEVAKLKQQGINKIILLSHSGLPNDKKIIEEVNGIDIIFSAHTHDLIKDIKEGENLFYSKNGEPIVITQAGKDGENAGILNVDFDKNGIIKKVQNNIIDINNYNRPLYVKDSVEKIIGKPEIVAVVKSAAPAPKNRLLEDNPHGNLIADAMRYELGTDIGLLNAGNIRGHFSEGKVDTRLVADITPFEDNMMILNLSEKQIIDAIKVGVEALKNGTKPGIMLVSGMKYTCDKNGNLLSAEFIDKDNKSHPIDVNNPSQTKKYTVATDDFIATGGDNYFPTNPNPDYVVQTFNVDKNKLACDYLKKFKEPIEIKSDGRIQIID